MKFGGTSVANIKIMKNAVSKISAEIDNDNKVIVVVSAMGNTTDNLVKKKLMGYRCNSKYSPYFWFFSERKGCL